MYLSRLIRRHSYVIPLVIGGSILRGGYKYYKFNLQREELYRVSKERLDAEDEQKRNTYLNQLKQFKHVVGTKIPIKPTSHLISMRGFLNINDKELSVEVAHVPKSTAPIYVSLYQQENGELKRVERMGKLEKKRWSMPRGEKERVQGKYLVVETYYDQVLGGAYITSV